MCGYKSKKKAPPRVGAGFWRFILVYLILFNNIALKTKAAVKNKAP